MDALELEALRGIIIRKLIVDCGDDAEDVVAEVFARMAMAIMAGRQILPAYVWQACHWEVQNLYRRRNSQHEAVNAKMPNVVAPSDEYVDPNSDAQIALAKLTPRQRAVVLLRADGYSYGEISDKLGIKYYNAKAAGRTDGRRRHPLIIPDNPDTPMMHTDDPIDSDTPVPGMLLTPRGLQVITGLSEGFTYKQIARQLIISPDTVKNLLVTAYHTLGAKSSAHAVAIAFRAGILK